MLQSVMGRAIMRLTEADLLGALVNDAYKPKMHKVSPVAAVMQALLWAFEQEVLLPPNFRRFRVSLAFKLAASFAMQVYAELFPGVQVDFCLNVRKSDWPPERIADEVRYSSAALTCHATQWRRMPVQQFHSERAL